MDGTRLLEYPVARHFFRTPFWYYVMCFCLFVDFCVGDMAHAVVEFQSGKVDIVDRITMRNYDADAEHPARHFFRTPFYMIRGH